MKGDFDKWFTGVGKHQMIVRHAVADWVVRTHDVQQGREQRQGVAVLCRGEVCNPLIGSTVRLRWAQHIISIITFIYYYQRETGWPQTTCNSDFSMTYPVVWTGKDYRYTA